MRKTNLAESGNSASGSFGSEAFVKQLKKKKKVQTQVTPIGTQIRSTVKCQLLS